MNKIALISIGLLASCVAQPVAAQTIVRTVDEITSKAANVGDAVVFSVDGCDTCSATGEVTFVERRDKRARDGRLTIEVREIDGAPATGRMEVKGKNVASDVLAGGAFGLAGVFFKGSDAKVKAGTAIEVELAQ